MGRLAFAQTPSAKLASDMEQSIDEVYEDLKAEGITTWTKQGDIPDSVVPHVAALAAFNRAEDISQERYQRVAGMAGRAKREIRRIVTPHYSSAEEPTDF